MEGAFGVSCWEGSFTTRISPSVYLCVCVCLSVYLSLPQSRTLLSLAAVRNTTALMFPWHFALLCFYYQCPGFPTPSSADTLGLEGTQAAVSSLRLSTSRFCMFFSKSLLWPRQLALSCIYAACLILEYVSSVFRMEGSWVKKRSFLGMYWKKVYDRQSPWPRLTRENLSGRKHLLLDSCKSIYSGRKEAVSVNSEQTGKAKNSFNVSDQLRVCFNSSPIHVSLQQQSGITHWWRMLLKWQSSLGQTFYTQN